MAEIKKIKGGDKQARATRRAKLGTLRSKRVSKQTLVRYDTAILLFFRWLDAYGRGEVPDTAESLDRFLAEYAEFLWEENESRHLFGDTLSGIGHYIQCMKKKLSV